MAEPRAFRKRPVVIEAMRFTVEDAEAVAVWAGDHLKRWPDGRREFLIPTLEGNMLAVPGDWIIKGVKGEFYPCKPDIFEATYQPADAEPDRDSREQVAALRAAMATLVTVGNIMHKMLNPLVEYDPREVFATRKAWEGALPDAVAALPLPAAPAGEEKHGEGSGVPWPDLPSGHPDGDFGGDPRKGAR